MWPFSEKLVCPVFHRHQLNLNTDEPFATSKNHIKLSHQTPWYLDLDYPRAVSGITFVSEALPSGRPAGDTFQLSIPSLVYHEDAVPIPFSSTETVSIHSGLESHAMTFLWTERVDNLQLNLTSGTTDIAIRIYNIELQFASWFGTTSLNLRAV